MSNIIKGSIRNLELAEGDILTLPFRPPKLIRKMGADYSSLAVIGMSHEYSSFVNTKNPIIPLEIYWNSWMIAKERRLTTGNFGASIMETLADEAEQMRRFLEALTLPSVTEDDMASFSTPDCVVYIPGFVTMIAKLTDFEEEILDQMPSGEIVEWTGKLTFKEQFRTRLSMQDVLTGGAFRAER